MEYCLTNSKFCHPSTLLTTGHFVYIGRSWNCVIMKFIQTWLSVDVCRNNMKKRSFVKDRNENKWISSKHPLRTYCQGNYKLIGNVQNHFFYADLIKSDEGDLVCGMRRMRTEQILIWNDNFKSVLLQVVGLFDNLVCFIISILITLYWCRQPESGCIVKLLQFGWNTLLSLPLPICLEEGAVPLLSCILLISKVSIIMTTTNIPHNNNGSVNANVNDDNISNNHKPVIFIPKIQVHL